MQPAQSNRATSGGACRASRLGNALRGLGLLEYAMIPALVAIVVVAVLMILGPKIGNVFGTVNTSLGSV